MSFLARASLANRKLVAIVTLLVVVFGVYVTTTLKQQLIPDLAFPAVTVVAQYPGASPEVVDEQVAKPIEGAVRSLDGLDTTTTRSSQGSAVVSLSFDFDVEPDDAANDVQQALSRLTATLPAGVEPQVLTGGTADLPTMVLAASSDGNQQRLAERLATSVVPELKSVPGVNDVAVSGVRNQVVTVTPRNSAVSTQPIVEALNALAGTNSAGSITSGGTNVSLAVGTSITSLPQLQALWLRTDPPVQLKDVAAVTLTDAPITSITSITRTDGKPSLGIAITMDHGGSAASISDGVRDELPDLEQTLGDGTALTVLSDSGPPVKKAVDGLFVEGLLGLAMAVLVIVAFLRSARSTLVTALSIPLSLLVALIGLWARDYSLNLLTLGGLTIAIGRVVDDSIVVLENIKRHLSYGEDRKHAVVSAVGEVAVAVTSSTLTTVAVFLPIALVGGIVGQIFAPFAVTVVVALLASLVVALTVIPVLAFWFLRTPKGAAPVSEADERNGRLPRTYLPVIHWAVRRRKTVLALALVLLIATVGMIPLLKTNFLGDSGETGLRITQTLPAGTDLATTDAAAAKVEKAIGSVPGVASYQTVVGSTGSGRSAAGSNTASYTVNLTDGADAGDVRKDLEDELDGAGELTFATPGSVGGGDIAIVVHAPDDTTLAAATKQIQTALEGVSEVTDVRSDLSESSPQFSIVADGEAAARYGLADTTIVSALRQAVDGVTVTQVSLDGAPRDVVVRSVTAAPHSLAQVRALTVPTATGPVRLDRVATVTQVDGPVQITSTDGSHTHTVSATPVGDDTGRAGAAVDAAVAKLTLPRGATTETGGVSANQSDAFSQLILAVLAAVALVFIVLITVFRSIRQTLVLLVSIPFAFVGAFTALLVTGTPLGLASLIGILMLIGIVVTNAIVLMDRVNQYREQGLSVSDAVVEGGLRRLRPILMTALATIFALVPMALGLTDAGGFISQPLAVVVIGGLLSSTLLTLVLIPVLYTMVETRRPHSNGA
ncbi:efflux RND transporter permease subunit [Cryptosporangium sp. NPDC048952]|uniref:efflux RND transporter permease subunit n=1 Tax=Cryptosporangium sp. NPDC048952 TaxID=3363961 RepID=UPI0037100A95